MELSCPWCDASVPAPSTDEATCGRCGESLVVGGRFRVRSVLGRGGMSTVYGAVDRLGEAVAVKVLRLQKVDGDGDTWTIWDSFERSGRMLPHLHHPGLPRVIAFDRGPGERPFLVRERFDGGTLAERIDDESRLDVEQMKALTRRLLEILEFLHGRAPPVIHRDIKPANIMFRHPDDERPVLVDFDTVAAPEAKRTGLTIVATAGYTAPEQFAGEATPGTDLYSVGATLLHVATGTPPEQLPRTHGHFELGDLLDELDAPLRRVLTRLVEPDPSKRYLHAAEALADLATEATTTVETASVPSRRAGSIVAAIGGASAVGLVMMAVLGPPAGVADELDACDDGDAQSCMNAASHYERGEHGLDVDRERARELYSDACDLGRGQACSYLGDMLVDVDDQQGATAAYQRGCERGYPRACQLVCHRVKNGKGVESDETAARVWCERGCNAEDPWSCNDLALFYRDGVGVPTDRDYAEALYDRACKGNDGLACHNLARMLVERDPARALTLENEACKLEIADACTAVTQAKLDPRGD